MPATGTSTTASTPEPTIGDVLTAVQGLGDRMDRVETRMDSLETGLSELFEFGKLQFAGLTTEIAKANGTVTRLDDQVIELRTDMTQITQRTSGILLLGADVEQLARQMRTMTPYVEESVKLGRSNRDLLLKVQGDIALLDQKIDRHGHDHEIHLPRPRSEDAPPIGFAA